MVSFNRGAPRGVFKREAVPVKTALFPPAATAAIPAGCFLAVDVKIAFLRGTASQCMQESRSRWRPLNHLFRRRAVDSDESRSRFGLSHEILGNRAIARFPRDSCRTHASATRQLDLAAWARLPTRPL
eukprot:9470713-Pyramimonas_sp.AAC.1